MFANAQLARLIAQSGNSFEGISLQGKFRLFLFTFSLTFLLRSDEISHFYPYFPMYRPLKSGFEERAALLCVIELENAPIKEAEARRGKSEWQRKRLLLRNDSLGEIAPLTARSVAFQGWKIQPRTNKNPTQKQRQALPDPKDCAQAPTSESLLHTALSE